MRKSPFLSKPLFFVVMRAAQRTQYGPPEVLQLREVEKPIPGEGELLVRVHASTVNRTDCGILWGKPWIVRFFTGLRHPHLKTTGTDFAGQVETVGPNVRSFQAGDRVWGFHDNGLQSHAEYLIVQESQPITTIPDNIGYPEAAASIEGAHYAYNFIRKAGMQAGKRVLVNGATGAIGSAAVQILVEMGMHVTAVCSGEHAKRILALGVERVIDLNTEDFTQDEQRYHFVLDAVGKSTFNRCKRLLEPKGIYLSSELGQGIPNPILALITPLFGGKKVRFPIPTDVPKSLAFLRKLLETGAFRPLIDRTYPPEQIQQAFHYVASGKKIGNVILAWQDETAS